MSDQDQVVEETVVKEETAQETVSNSDSSIDEKEQKWQERLAASTKDMLFSAAFSLSGILLLTIGLLMGPNSSAYSVFLVLAYFVPGVPVIIPMVKKRSLSGIFSLRPAGPIFAPRKTHYTMADSPAGDALGRLFVTLITPILIVIFACALAAILALFRFIWLIAKSITSYIKVKAKPAFLSLDNPLAILSGFVAGIVVFVLLLSLFA
jgi:hypothetical protein